MTIETKFMVILLNNEFLHCATQIRYGMEHLFVRLLSSVIKTRIITTIILLVKRPFFHHATIADTTVKETVTLHIVILIFFLFLLSPYLYCSKTISVLNLIETHLMSQI